MSRGCVAPHRLRQALLCLTIAFTDAGCVRFLEENDPPGTYRASSGDERIIVLHQDGRYERRTGGEVERGHWVLGGGCSMGLSRLELTRDPTVEQATPTRPERVDAAEGWFHDVVLYTEDGAAFEKQ